MSENTPCRACGASNPSDAAACSRCGAELTADRESAGGRPRTRPTAKVSTEAPADAPSGPHTDETVVLEDRGRPAEKPAPDGDATRGRTESPTSAPTVQSGPPDAWEAGGHGADEPHPGDTLAGRFHLLEELGRGGMGVVYRARDLQVDEVVALKVLAPRIARDEDQIAAFKQEMRLTRTITHRQICRIHDLGEDEGVWFITMQHVRGESLAAVLRMVGPMPEERVREICRQICHGLQEAHQLGIVHRDLKPANVMVDEQGQAVIMDFGLAVAPSRPPAEAPGEISGTPSYMAPEQVAGRAVDRRADLYALGCMIYELLTGEPPFTGTTLEVLRSHLDQAPPQPHRARPGIDPRLEWIVLRCLSKDPADRFQDAAELGAALDEERGLQELLETDPMVRSVARPDRSTAVLGGLAALALVAAPFAYRASSPGAALRLELPRAAVPSIARQIAGDLGYDATGYEVDVSLGSPSFDLERVFVAGGLVAARRAVASSEVAMWGATLTRPASEAGAEGSGPGARGPPAARPAGMSMAIDLRGRLRQFVATLSGEPVPLETAAARSWALRLADDVLGVSTDGFEVEVTPGSDPGAVLVRFDNPQPRWGHVERVEALFSGERVERLAWTRVPVGPDPAGAGSLRGSLRVARQVAIVLTALALMVIAAVHLARGRRWVELRDRTAIGASLVFASGFFTWQLQSDTAGAREQLLVFGLVVVAVSPAILLIVGSVLARLRDLSPVRLVGLEGLFAARPLGEPAASSLLHGALAGALVFAIPLLSAPLLARLPGHTPLPLEELNLIDVGSAIGVGLSELAQMLLAASLMAWIVELTARWSPAGAPQVLLAAVLFGLSSVPLGRPGAEAWTTVGYVFAALVPTTLAAAVFVWVYRARGLAAAWLAYGVPNVLTAAMMAWSLGDPAMRRQAGVLAAILVAATAVGAAGCWLASRHDVVTATDAPGG